MRMLSANCWLSSAVLLAVFCHTLSLEPSFHNNKSPHGINDETRCSWNCTVLDSDFSEEMKTTIAKKKVVQLVVKYEIRVTEKCENQTSRISSGNITEHWQIWLPSKQHSVFEKALESVANLMFYCREEIRAICTLRPVNTTATKPTYDNGSFPIFSRSHLADLGVKFSSIDCNAETTDNLQHCIDITKSTGNNSGTFEGLFKRRGWARVVLGFLISGFSAVFTYYSLAFLCLFSPTEVTEDGVHQIVLDGASPVSIRSLIGNYFFSKEDTIWHRARMFMLRVVVIPLPFLGPAMLAEYLRQSTSLTFKSLYVSHQFRIVSYVCYNIMACYTLFSSAGPYRVPNCIICERIKSKTLNCQGNIPKRIRNHLRIQPLILVECWRLFIGRLLIYFKSCFLLFPSAFEFSSSFLVRLFLFIALLSASPVVTIILLTFMLLVISIALLITSPAYTILFDAIKHVHKVSVRPNRYSCLCIMIGVLIPITASFGIYAFLSLAGFGVFMAIILAFVMLLTEESLPFVACFVLVLYYLWSSYSSFTNKYHDLGLAIFKHYKSYKKSRHSQVTDMAINAGSPLENTQIAADNKDSELKIPQKLFHTACEQLMPIRESFCLLILKVTIIVSFLFLVFILTILLNANATPVMRALIAFFTGSFPKIVTIYIGGSRRKEIEAMIAEEKIPEIVQRYIDETPAANQQHVNSG